MIMNQLLDQDAHINNHLLQLRLPKRIETNIETQLNRCFHHTA